jgi:hypothetical protein
MFKMSLKYIYIYTYTFYAYALYVSATRGHLQATHLLTNPLHCALSIALLKYVVIIINFGVIGCLFCVPLGVPLP